MVRSLFLLVNVHYLGRSGYETYKWSSKFHHVCLVLIQRCMLDFTLGDRRHSVIGHLRLCIDGTHRAHLSSIHIYIICICMRKKERLV